MLSSSAVTGLGLFVLLILVALSCMGRRQDKPLLWTMTTAYIGVFTYVLYVLYGVTVSLH